MWVLALNSIHGRAEDREPLVRAETKEELVKFVESCKVERYVEKGPGGYGNEFRKDYEFVKYFRKGCPLEEYNLPADDPSHFINVRTIEDHLREAEIAVRGNWERTILSLPVANL